MRYAKDVISYLEKRAQIEVEFAKKLGALAHGTLAILHETATDQGLYNSWREVIEEHSHMASRQSNLHSLPMQMAHIQPLVDARADHDKLRKMCKDTWNRLWKKLQDSIITMQKARVSSSVLRATLTGPSWVLSHHGVSFSDQVW